MFTTTIEKEQVADGKKDCPYFYSVIDFVVKVCENVMTLLYVTIYEHQRMVYLIGPERSMVALVVRDIFF